MCKCSFMTKLLHWCNNSKSFGEETWGYYYVVKRMCKRSHLYSDHKQASIILYLYIGTNEKSLINLKSLIILFIQKLLSYFSLRV